MRSKLAAPPAADRTAVGDKSPPHRRATSPTLPTVTHTPPLTPNKVKATRVMIFPSPMRTIGKGLGTTLSREASAKAADMRSASVVILTGDRINFLRATDFDHYAVGYADDDLSCPVDGSHGFTDFQGTRSIFKMCLTLMNHQIGGAERPIEGIAAVGNQGNLPDGIRSLDRQHLPDHARWQEAGENRSYEDEEDKEDAVTDPGTGVYG